jgi:hypothetical protein
MSLTTTFLIRGVGFDAGEVGMVNKNAGLFATIRRPVRRRPDAAPDAVSGAADFRLLQGYPTPATGCCRLPISTSIPWRPRFFENLCGEWGRRRLSRC